MSKFKFLNKKEVSRLPKTAGVYVFKKMVKRGAPLSLRKSGEDDERVGVLYVGKASNLRKRVKNHFQQPGYRDNLFINQVEKIGYIKTNSEIDALILEANLIKKYQPKYNVVWRDDKNYFFVGMTKEDFPKIFWTHQTKIKKILAKKQKIEAEFIGPFVEGTSLKQTLKILRKVFPYRSCNKIPKRPCLWYQLGKCPAPCLLKSLLAKQIPTALIQIQKECQRNAKNLIKIFQKGKIPVLKDLKKEMKIASVSQDFEKAAKIRDQISALEKVLAHAKIFEPADVDVIRQQFRDWNKLQKILQKILRIKNKISRIEAYDVSNIQGQKATGSMVTFINGLPDKNFYRKFKIKVAGKPDDIAMLKEILTRRFKHREWPYPDLILIDGGRAQLKAARQYLRSHLKQIEIMALAKRKSELFTKSQEKPILLKSLPRKVFNLILQLRDQAHRFARKYHLKLREFDFFPRS